MSVAKLPTAEERGEWPRDQWLPGTTTQEPISFLVYNTGEHASTFTFVDEQIVRDRWWKITPRDLVLDIGAGFGSYTLPALAAGAITYVYSPPHHDYYALTQNVILNGYQTRCVMTPIGCYSADGWLDFDGAFRSEEFPDAFMVAPLDGIAEQHRWPKVTYIKLDVEGAELEVLKGAEHTLKKFRPQVLIENHTFIIPDIDKQCRSFLEGIGYTHIDTVPHHSVSHSLYR